MLQINPTCGAEAELGIQIATQTVMERHLGKYRTAQRATLPSEKFWNHCQDKNVCSILCILWLNRSAQTKCCQSDKRNNPSLTSHVMNDDHIRRLSTVLFRIKVKFVSSIEYWLTTKGKRIHNRRTEKNTNQTTKTLSRHPQKWTLLFWRAKDLGTAFGQLAFDPTSLWVILFKTSCWFYPHEHKKSFKPVRYNRSIYSTRSALLWRFAPNGSVPFVKTRLRRIFSQNSFS